MSQESEESPVISISYQYLDGRVSISVDTKDGIDPATLAEFLCFISSKGGVASTIETIKEGMESMEGEYDEFITSFLTFKQEEVAQLQAELKPNGPMISPLDVL